MAAAAASSSSSGPITKAASAQEPPIIGFEKDKAKIIDAMLDPNHPELSYIAIIGERGVGKTTLAKEIYASAEVQQDFDVHIWCVGGIVNAFDEIRTQIIGIDSHSWKTAEEVREYLSGKKYCLVIDNSWGYYRLDKISEAFFPDNKKGSRVLICSLGYTRLEIPQVLMNHVVGYRSEEESLEILIRAANLNLNLNPRTPTTNSMQEMLDLIRHSFLPLCDGRPWPLRFMGSLLSMLPPNLHSWINLSGTFIAKKDKYYGRRWRYNDLAMKFREMKFSERAAFLSFLTYPPDAHIPAHALLRKWTASRIAQDDAHANRMLQDFVEGSIVQIEERPINGRLVKVCQMVDPLVRALAVQEAREKRYVRVCSNHWGAIYSDIFSKYVLVDNHMVKKGDNFNAEKIDVTQLVDSTCGIFNWSSETKTMLSWSRVLEVNSSQNIRDVERALMEMECPRYLGLRNSGLLHEITNIVGLLDHLETLVVEGTPLETLPPGLLRENVPLKHLIFSDTKLQEIPLSIQNLKLLETLEVSGSPLETLPPGLWSQDIPLKHLILSDTKLQEIPLSIQNLKMLETLNVSGAPIKFLPEFIGNLKHLRTLDVSGTFLDTIPKFFRKLTNLKTLNISNTPIKTLPIFFLNLKILVTLNISGTSLKTLPDVISNLTYLEIMDISGRTSLETLPYFIESLEYLKTLDIHGTSLKIHPDFIGNLRYFLILDPSIIETIPDLRRLLFLHTSSTFIETIPDFMSNLKDLNTLDIGNPFGEVIGRLKNLKILNFNSAPIKSLPASIRNLQDLRTLDISGTFIDTIPEVIGKLTSLRTLDIRDTFIRFIPYSVWNLPILRSVLSSDSLEHLDGPPNSLQYSNLETLTIVHVSETWKKNAVPKLPSLRELGLSSYNRARIRKLENNWHPAFNLLGTLENLSSLKLQGSHIPARIIHVDICPSYSKKLTELWVGGSQSLFSLHDITMPPCLTNLTLENLEFEEDPMPVLGKLENLKILRLRLLLDAAPAARKMTCSSNLFSCLEKLELYHLTGLEEWSIEERAVPKLTHVLIQNCKALKALPHALLQRETPLQELHLHSMPSAFTVDIPLLPFVKITNKWF